MYAFIRNGECVKYLTQFCGKDFTISYNISPTIRIKLRRLTS